MTPNPSKPSAAAPMIASAVGACLLFIVWLGVKFGFNISDRYLPSPQQVLAAVNDIRPSILIHTLATATRILLGITLGVATSLALALAMCRYSLVRSLLLPSVQALRAVPAVATVPFFLLWFGFSETGKVLMVLIGVALNILVAADHILSEIPEKYAIALRSFGHSIGRFPFSVALPLIVERLQPAIRTAAATIFGVVIVSELLGSQLGLGYLIQTSYTTYSIHVIFLATIMLGLLNVMFDAALRHAWGRIYFWNRGDATRNS